MTILSALNNAKINTVQRVVIEPLNAPRTIQSRLDQFFPPNLYTHSKQSTLYKFLTTLLGDAGVNGFKKNMLYPRLMGSIHNTHFRDLDTFFGNPLNLPRIEDEIYSFDPLIETLTQDEWAEVRRKDAWYRARCLDYMLAIQKGNTPEGIKQLAKAASGIECDIFERWLFLDDQMSDDPIGVANVGLTNNVSEFVIIPRVSTLSPKAQKRISQALSRIKPANTSFSIRPESSPRIEIPIKGIETSSDYFQAERLVTGNRDIQYPPIDPASGLWIEPGEEKEAPLYAFGAHSDHVTWPSILAATATSSHAGPFNQLQQRLFPHLQNVLTSTIVRFDPSQAFLNYPVNLQISTPWVGRNSTVFVNDHFALGYLADPAAPSNINYGTFWASEERMPSETDELVIELTSERSLNYIQFECSTKPYKIEIEYWDVDQWRAVNLVDNYVFENKQEIIFTASSYSWEDVQIAFDQILTDKVKIRFVRQTTPFPYPHSPLFAWSIEVRNLRVANVVSTIEDFLGTPDPDNSDRLIGDEGIDILGNSFRTELDRKKYAAERMTDNSLNTYWQSQANPSRFAVESIYVDMRDDDGNATSFDEIYIDPITTGVLMHVYYSNDDLSEAVEIPAESSFNDYRLWQPIQRHFVLTKGYHSLKRTITAKYLKIEFTKLTPTPYESVENAFRPITYRVYPSWVQKYITNAQEIRQDDSPFKYIQNTQVSLDYVNLGLQNPQFTKLTSESPDSIEDFQVEDSVKTSLSEYQTWINPTRKTNELVINVYPNNLFQIDIKDTLKFDSFLNTVLYNQDLTDIFIKEQQLEVKPLLEFASKGDRILVEQEKTYPDMWFPIIARHGYQIVETERNFNLAYFVAIKEISVHRLDHTFPKDEPFYNEALADSFNISQNTFEQTDWRFIIPDTYLGEAQTISEFSVLGDENYDVLTPARTL